MAIGAGALLLLTGAIGLIQLYGGYRSALSVKASYGLGGCGVALTSLGCLGCYWRRQQFERTPVTEKPASRTLEPLPGALRNPPTALEGAAIYHGYNAEGIRDFSWGCAWRAIQTCLSGYKKQIDFEQLFRRLGSAEALKTLYQRKHGQELVADRPFAPHDLINGWAEPFIGEMVLFDQGIDSRLEYVHAIPDRSTSPRQVFRYPALNFATLRQRLVQHFTVTQENPRPAPVMIDDGLSAMAIVGARQEGSQIRLWMGDPHIGEGVNREGGRSGLYLITLNEQGQQQNCSLDGDAQEQARLFSPRLYKTVDFATKPWMVLFPLPVRPS